MTTERPTQPAAIMEQAAEWYWRICEPDVSAETLCAWQTWLRASQQNRAAFARIEASLQQVDQVREVPWPTEEELLNDHYDGSMPIAEWRARRPARGIAGIKGGAWRGKFNFKTHHWAIAASVVLLIAAAEITTRFGLWSGLAAPPDFALYETQAAEHRELHLPDGSTVTLGGKSIISTAYTPASRLVILKQGAAFFDVEKDADRPFIVQAGSRRIAAVGTAFNVTRQADRVVVTVTEGAVTVTPELQEPSASTKGADIKGANEVGIARLEAGHRLVYSDQQVTPVTLADAADAIAWREGRLKYRGELLRYVIDDVNRYANRPIVLADEAAGEVSFTGTVFEQSIDTWLSGLEQVFPLEVEQTPERVVIRHKANKAPSKEM